MVTALFVYELPFGKGKRMFDTSNRLLDAAVGGWQLNGIYRQTSGLPIGVGNGGFWPANWTISGYATHAHLAYRKHREERGGKTVGAHLCLLTRMLLSKHLD